MLDASKFQPLWFEWNLYIGSLSAHVSKYDPLILHTPANSTNFGSIHFNKNIEDYWLKLMCCVFTAMAAENNEKTDINWNLHRKTYEFFPHS